MFLQPVTIALEIISAPVLHVRVILRTVSDSLRLVQRLELVRVDDGGVVDKNVDDDAITTDGETTNPFLLKNISVLPVPLIWASYSTRNWG